MEKRTNLARMIHVNIHDAKTRLSSLIRAVEQQGETIILQRHGRPVAEIHAYGSSAVAAVPRDLTPDSRLIVTCAEGFDPAEVLSEDEWPDDLR